MEKTKVFISKIEDVENKKKEINKFLEDKRFISLTKTQSMGNQFTMVILTLTYEEK